LKVRSASCSRMVEHGARQRILCFNWDRWNALLVTSTAPPLKGYLACQRGRVQVATEH